MVRNSKIVIRSQTSREKDKKKVVTEGLKMTFDQTVTNASFH